MSIAWTPNLSVGVEHIDDQHKIWFEKANALFEAGKEKRAKEYIKTMLDFLDEYTKKHFKDEEAFMVEIRYPAKPKLMRLFAEKLAKLKAIMRNRRQHLVILNANSGHKLALNHLDYGQENRIC